MPEEILDMENSYVCSLDEIVDANVKMDHLAKNISKK
jgi:hypothetical protein